jgi:hypothetical protein
VAGWECQDLSAAGSGRGLRGSRSSSYFPLRQLVQQLQEACSPPLGYLLENTAFRYNFNYPAMGRQTYSRVCAELGDAVTADAAQFGSYAHRLRHYWSNLYHTAEMEAALEQVQRPPGLLVQHILDPGRSVADATNPEPPPYYRCNTANQPLSCLPTLVAFVGSHSHRPGRAGAVTVQGQQQQSELNPDERERAMGYQTGTTDGVGVTPLVRHEVLGRCMDQNVLSGMFVLAQAWGNPEQRVHAAVVSQQTEVDYPVAAALYPDPDLTELPPILQCHALALAAVHEESGRQQVSDIWADQPTLSCLQQAQAPAASLPLAERQRIGKRLRLYSWDGIQLKRHLTDGSTRIVPPPLEREALIKRTHAGCGHFGQHRTAALVMLTYWWHNVKQQVIQTVRKCEVCSRVVTSFSAKHPVLHPLPIMGMFYRWGVDLCGPFPATTPAGFTYIMVAIEHFSKAVELIPLVDKSAASTAAAFATIIGRYGAMAEVLTDQGAEWQAEFAQLLLDCMIDHRQTSAYHPQADGLAERAVQTVKNALRKMCHDAASADSWDRMLPWISLGYRCSPQASTGLSPYRMLYAREPVVPPAIMQRMEASQLALPPCCEPKGPGGFSHNPAYTAEVQKQQELAAADLCARARLVQQDAIMAGDNLRIAQHRDTLQYARRHGGDYHACLRRFNPGDFVYVQRPLTSALQIRAAPYILKVLMVHDSGVLTLQARDGQTRTVHSEQCAPCHLPTLTLDHSTDWVADYLPCEVCQDTAAEHPRHGPMLVCDGCNTVWHLRCLQPPLHAVPEGLWTCPRCMPTGLTPQYLADQQQQARVRAEQARRVDAVFPGAATKRRDTAAADLQGRWVIHTFRQPGQRTSHREWGQLHFRGAQHRPAYFVVHFATRVSAPLTMADLTSSRYQLQPAGTPPPTGWQTSPDQ